jgi:hypothetical protein
MKDFRMIIGFVLILMGMSLILWGCFGLLTPGGLGLCFFGALCLLAGCLVGGKVKW